MKAGGSACRLIEAAEEAFKVRAASVDFGLSTLERICEACLMLDNSLKFAQRMLSVASGLAGNFS